MKAQLQHLGFDNVNESIQAYWVISDKFGFHWHYHPELEITYVIQGKGTRLVGDHVFEFQAGDFVLLGPNLPHTWITDDEFNQKEEDVKVIVIQFHPALFHENTWAIPELHQIRKTLEEAKRGLFYSHKTVSQIDTYVKQMLDATGFERFHLLLSLLQRLGNSGEFHPLASQLYTPTIGKGSEERILNVCRYIHDHFTEPVELEMVAGIANMNASAFCRFFKKFTGKTLLEYVNDLRIGKACNMLMEEKLSISEIAFISGFNNLTHFNRSFLKRKGTTPSSYRKKYKNKLPLSVS